MMSIWKFPLAAIQQQKIWMPVGAKILTVQAQFNHACLWALVDTTRENSNRDILMLATGQEIRPEVIVGAHYIGTFQLNEGSLIFHVFERR